MKLFAVYYHRRNRVPTCCGCRSERSFFQCCQLVSTDWALLLNEAGETLASYPLNNKETTLK